MTFQYVSFSTKFFFLRLHSLPGLHFNFNFKLKAVRERNEAEYSKWHSSVQCALHTCVCCIRHVLPTLFIVASHIMTKANTICVSNRQYFSLTKLH